MNEKKNMARAKVANSLPINAPENLDIRQGESSQGLRGQQPGENQVSQEAEQDVEIRAGGHE